MKTILSFLAVLALSVLAMALGSGQLAAASLLPAVGTAALFAAASTDRLPRRRTAPNSRGTASGQSWPGAAACTLCVDPAS
jgi:hypothetical protein